MKAHTGWSYKHYYPKGFNGGDIHVCRIVPLEQSVTFDWIGVEGDCEIYLRKRETGEFELVGNSGSGTFTVDGLIESMEYEFYVKCGDKRSRVRLFRCAKPFDTVVTYLHPDDDAYSFSGKYLCSPSLVRHPDGYLLTSMDLYEYGSGQNLTMIYRSDDEGKTWKYSCQLFPSFWTKLMVHKGEVYAISASTEYGDLLIGKSADGENWGEPTVLLRGCGGKKGPFNVGAHCNPQPEYHFGGRIWSTLEWGSWASPSKHGAMVMSADENADLLDANSWSFTEPTYYNPNWEGLPTRSSSGTIEGTICERDGKLYNLMRYDMFSAPEGFGKALKYEINLTDYEAPIKYVGTVDLPANHSKFAIRYHEGLKKYFTIATRLPDREHNAERKILSLMVSDDLKKFDLVYDIVNDSGKREDNGYQYVYFIIEGNKILYCCRTAINRAHNFHDSNYSTFGVINLEDYFSELKK